MKKILIASEKSVGIWLTIFVTGTSLLSAYKAQATDFRTRLMPAATLGASVLKDCAAVLAVPSANKSSQIDGSLRSLIDQLPEKSPSMGEPNEYAGKVASFKIYNIPTGMDPVTWLQDLVEVAKSTNSTLIPRNQLAVIQGDALHWIGHIFESQGQFRKAGFAYLSSLESYEKSDIKFSIGISNGYTHNHAVVHLKELLEKFSLPIPPQLQNQTEKIAPQSPPEITQSLKIYQTQIQTLTSN